MHLQFMSALYWQWFHYNTHTFYERNFKYTMSNEYCAVQILFSMHRAAQNGVYTRVDGVIKLRRKLILFSFSWLNKKEFCVCVDSTSNLHLELEGLKSSYSISEHLHTTVMMILFIATPHYTAPQPIEI